MSLSVTVSIGLLTTGTLSEIRRVNCVLRVHSDGRISLKAGSSKTSSKVIPLQTMRSCMVEFL